MRNKKEYTDFVNFGTYRAEEADILKHEFEKQGIPVKLIYPGTSIGRESTAEMYFPAYKLMIQACDFSIAEGLRKKFNIEPIELGREMPLPKVYNWTKKGLNRFALIACFLSYLGTLITGYLADKLEFFPENTPFYFIIAFFIFFFILLCSIIYNIFKGKEKID